MNIIITKKQFLITSILSLCGIILVLSSCHEGASDEVGDPFCFPFKVADKPVLYYSQEMGNVVSNYKIFRMKESTRVAIMRKYFPVYQW